MISKRAYSILVAESYGGSRISLAEDEGESATQMQTQTTKKMTINSETWEMLEKLSNGEGWPRSDAYVKKKYEELSAQYEKWPDRLATLNEAYQNKVKMTSAHSEL